MTVLDLRKARRERGLDTLRFDLLARARRPWRVQTYPVTIAPSRSQPEQMQIVYDPSEAAISQTGPR